MKKSSLSSSIRVHYVTSPSARALQFLTPDQTTDKTAPFLFSQCQVRLGWMSGYSNPIWAEVLIGQRASENTVISIVSN